MNVLNAIKAIVIVDLTGRRALAKYYDGELRDTNKFERQLFARTKANRSKDGIFILDNSIVIHRFASDHHIFMVGARDENPLILDRVLNCLIEVLNILMNRNPDKKTFHDNLDQIIIALDEICEQGTLLETDPNLVIDRVCLDSGVAEQSLAQVLQSAAEIRFPWIR